MGDRAPSVIVKAVLKKTVKLKVRIHVRVYSRIAQSASFLSFESRILCSVRARARARQRVFPSLYILFLCRSHRTPCRRPLRARRLHLSQAPSSTRRLAPRITLRDQETHTLHSPQALLAAAAAWRHAFSPSPPADRCGPEMRQRVASRPAAAAWRRRGRS